MVLVGVIVGVGVGVGLDGAQGPMSTTVIKKPGKVVGSVAEQTVTVPDGGIVGNGLRSQSNPNSVTGSIAELLVIW
jgi:hypothetical protein